MGCVSGRLLRPSRPIARWISAALIGFVLVFPLPGTAQIQSDARSRILAAQKALEAGKFDESLTRLGNAQEEARAAGDLHLAAMACWVKAEVLHAQQHHADSQKAAAESIMLERSARSQASPGPERDAEFATILYQAANWYVGADRSQQAEKLTSEALQVAEAAISASALPAADLLRTASYSAWDNAVLLADLSRNSEAAKIAQRALGFLVRLDSAPDSTAADHKQAQRGLAVIEQNIGNYLTAQLKPGAALEHYNVAIARFEKLVMTATDANERLRHVASKGRALRDLGDALLQLFRFRECLEAFTLARSCMETAGNKKGIADIALCIGSYHETRGEYSAALLEYTNALTVSDANHDVGLAVRSLRRRGGAMMCVGQFENARLDYTRAKKEALAIKDGDSLADSIISLGLIEMHMHRYDAALSITKEGLNYLNMARAFHFNLDEGNYAQVHLSLGMIYWFKEDADAALREFDLSAPFVSTINSSLFAGWLAMGRSLATALKGDYERSLVYATELKTAIAGYENSLYNAFAEGLVGLCYDRMGRYADADIQYAKCVQLLEESSLQLGDPVYTSAIQQIMPRPYGRYARLLQRRGLGGAAVGIMEQGRAWGIAQQNNLNGSDYTARLSDADRTQFESMNRERYEAGRSLIEARKSLQSNTEDGSLLAAVASARAKLQSAENAFTRFHNNLFAKYPQLRARQPHPYTVYQIQSLADSHPDAVYIEWILVDQREMVAAVVSAHKPVRAFLLPTGEGELRNLIGRYRTAISASNRGAPITAAPGSGAAGGRGQTRAAVVSSAPSGPAEPEPVLARRIYDCLFGQIEAAGILGGAAFRRLVLVPDGPIRDVPFCALLDRSGARLVSRYSISTAISLSTLEQPNPRTATKTLLCIADPLGGGAGPMQVASASTRNAQAPTRPTLRAEEFSPLKFARQEGSRVAALFQNPKLLQGDSARKGSVQDAMGDYNVLHFATHGELNSNTGDLSCLILADGVLEAREIMNLPIAARLVTLSACDTGRGQESASEGAIGLAWAFRAAGCPSVVASQWSVDDAATGKLMVSFYNHLYGGRTKDEALRLAMLEVMNDKIHANPFYWAAFQVIGDTTPLFKKAKTLPEPSRAGHTGSSRGAIRR